MSADPDIKLKDKNLADINLERVPLGRISGVHGIKGWVRVFSDTDPREAIFEYQPWLLGPEENKVEILSGRKQGKHLVAELDGVNHRDDAEALIGTQIAVYREQLPELTEEHFYWLDLIGLSVTNQDGFDFGTIAEMIATGAHDVMLVRGDKDRLIPFVKDVYVTSVDFASERVSVDWDPDF